MRASCACVSVVLSLAAVAAEPDSPLKIVRVEASSSLPQWKGYTFSATNLTDGKLDTSWQPRSAASGIGEWFRIDFDGEVLLSQCSVANGLQRVDALGDLFLLNSRLRKARLVFADGTEQAVTFDPAQRGYASFDISKVRTTSLRVVVDEVEAGSRFNDLAVSEIVCRGTSVASAKQALIIILGEGEAAPTAMVDWARREHAVDAAASWPMVIDSGSVAGLKAGQPLAVLGVCPMDKAVVAEAAIRPHILDGHAYLKKVKWSAAFACPTLHADYKVMPIGRLVSGDYSLQVSKVETRGGSTVWAVFELLDTRSDAQGLLLEVRGPNLVEAQRVARQSESLIPPSVDEVDIVGDQLETHMTAGPCPETQVVERTTLRGPKIISTWTRGETVDHCGD